MAALNLEPLKLQLRRLILRVTRLTAEKATMNTSYTELLATYQVQTGTVAQLVSEKSELAASLLLAGTEKETLASQLASVTAQSVLLASNDAADAATIEALQTASDVSAQQLANAGIEKAELEAAASKAAADAALALADRDAAVADANTLRLQLEAAAADDAAQALADAEAQALINAATAEAEAAANAE